MRRPLLVILLVALASCGSDARTPAHFCDRLRASMPVLTAPVRSAAAADLVAKEFDSLSKLTPLAIEDDWASLTDLVQTAATMDLADPSAQAALADKAFATSAAAKNVVAYVRDRCGVDLSTAVPTASTATSTTEAATPSTGG